MIIMASAASSSPPTIKDATVTAQNLNNRLVTLSRVIGALDSGIELQDEILLGTSAANYVPIARIVEAKKAEANKMKTDLAAKSSAIKKLISDYDAFTLSAGANNSDKRMDFMAKMNSLITDFDDYIKSAKTSPYIANILSGTAGGRRSARRSVRRSRKSKRKNRTNRR